MIFSIKTFNACLAANSPGANPSVSLSIWGKNDYDEHSPLIHAIENELFDFVKALL